MLKKVLILTYSFPPSNHPSAHRADAWAKHLSSFGYYPIFITRNWDIPLKNTKDAYIPTGDDIKHQKTDTYEVYYVPFRPTFREKLFVKWRNTNLNIPYLSLFFLEGIAEKFTNKVISFANIYDFARKYLKDNKDIQQLIITAAPFQLFKFAHLLHKEFNITWIADYQDDWTTNELIIDNLPKKILNQFNRIYEKKWLESATYITSVTPLYLKRTLQLLKKEGSVLYLGYDNIEQFKPIENKETFTIIYNGSLYNSQNVSIFINAFKKLIDSHPYNSIKLLFLGLAFNEQSSKRVQNLLKGYENYYTITERLSKEEYMGRMLGAQILLLIAYGNLKGILPTKLYEYIACKKQILFCPSDNDAMQKILEETDLATFCNTAETTYTFLKAQYHHWKKNKNTMLTPNEDAIAQYSRKQQTKRLAEILDGI